MGMTAQRILEAEHPAVLVAFVVAMTAITMCALHPVFVAISLVGALVSSCAVCGPRRTWGALSWQLPLLVLVSLVNLVLSRAGATPLWQWGPLSIRLEGLAFGLCMGMLLVSSLMWLWCAGTVLTPDRLLALGGTALPTVGLMVSMVMRLVPQLVARGRRIGAVRAACSGARGASGALTRGVRVSGILLGWSLEDSLERGDAMRARGWVAGRRRSQYLPRSLSATDVARLAALLALAGMDASLAWVACSQWRFYPTMPHLAPWWGYLPHLLLALLPAAVALVDRGRWAIAGRRPCRGR